MNFYKKNITILASLFFVFITNIFFATNLRPSYTLEIHSDSLKKQLPAIKSTLNNAPPVLTATGNQVYCPNSYLKIVTDMTIVDPDDSGADAFYIQISSGYVNGQDFLSLVGGGPNITSSWDASTGKLTLTSPTNVLVSYSDFIAAIKNVVFFNSSNTPSGTRTFSITIGEANYLPSTGHYYRFIPSLGITWTNAKVQAEASTYYGLQGYLATLTSAEEAQLSGKQASGAGWIGGNDIETEGVWKWVTGPEAGTVFWNGQANGSTPNYAFWNTSEPNNLNGEHYAHITAPGVGIPGSWNDLANEGASSGDYQPKGYIVEYGGMPGDPVLNISTSTTISIPSITSVASASRCGTGTVTLSAVSSAGLVKWYDAPNGGNLLATGSSFTTPTISATTTYYADSSETGCATFIRSSVIATVNPIPLLTFTTPAPLCEGRATLTASADIGQVRWFASETDTTPLATGNSYTTPEILTNTTYYVDAINNGCVSGNKIPVNLIVYSKPVVTDESLTICENSSKTLDAGLSNMAYLWPHSNETTRTVTVSGPGTYTVTVTNQQNCSSVKTFTVTEKITPVISTISIKDTEVTIKTVMPGDFEYSVDGTNYQPSNIFIVDKPGINTAFVREKNGCGSDKKDFIIIIVPAFFTPNNDNHNDLWIISGMVLYPKSKAAIFDRFGKLVCELNQNNYSWNGTYKGLPLPSSDYWYVLKIDDGFPEIHGHFSLIR